MILSTTPRLGPENSISSPMSSATVQSAQSPAPSSTRHGITAPDMSHRTPSELAVIQALQAVANYPESRDFVETVSRQMPGLQNLLGTTGQPEKLRGHKRKSRSKHQSYHSWFQCDQTQGPFSNSWLVTRF